MTAATRQEREKAQVAASTVPRKFLRLRDVLAATGLSRSSLYRLVREAKFPAPVHLGARTAAWLASEIDAYIEARAAERVTA